jgi:hypothetical protein
MSDEEKRNPRRRRFDPSMRGPKMPDANVMGVMGQMLGGIGTGLGAGLANKMNERMTVAAAALQGLLMHGDRSYPPREAAKHAVDYADALLAELEKKPDPRFPDTTQMPSIQTVVEEP